MGLVPSFLRLIIREMNQNEFEGPVLTLGVPDIPVTYEQALTLFAKEGVEPCEVPPGERELSGSLLLRSELKSGRQLIHARTFFRMLGLREIHGLDASDQEAPDLIHDLQTPVPAAWHGRYGLVIDCGTTEHILDVRSTLSNTVRVLRVGGSVLHFNPVAGWPNHGFFQLSPCLFYDFYGENGFRPLDAKIVQLPTGNICGAARVCEYQHTLSTLNLTDPAYRCTFFFAALKVRDVPEIRMPVQGKYRPRMKSHKSALAAAVRSAPHAA